MTTKLDKQLKREIEIEGKAYTLTFAPEGLKVTEKGRQKGYEIAWKDIISGQATGGGSSAAASA